MKKSEKGTRYAQTPYLNQAPKLMSTQPDSDPFFDDVLFQQNLPQYYREILKNFRKISQSFIRFNLLYFSFFACEIFLFSYFLSNMVKTAVFAFSLGGIFLTCFSYFVLLFYYQAKKPEQLSELKDKFLNSCRQILSLPPGEVQHHLSLADALSKLAEYLNDYENLFFRSSKVLKFFPKLISRFSKCCYLQDVYKMKMYLLLAAVDEHLSQVRVTPTDLEVHASLANTYIALSKLYQEADDEKNYLSHAKLAIEEFSILSNYAPNDPWVHEQLAVGYQNLKMPDEEIREVETLLKLRSQDKEILYRLGSLYFKQGMNAKGLQIYEELKKANFKKAEDLIFSYGRKDLP